MACYERITVKVVCDWCRKVVYDGPKDDVQHKELLNTIAVKNRHNLMAASYTICDDCLKKAEAVRYGIQNGVLVSEEET